MKATELHFPVVLFINMMYKVDLTSESANVQILKCVHSKKSA